MWFTKHTQDRQENCRFFLLSSWNNLFATCSHYPHKPDKMISPIKLRLNELKRYLLCLECEWARSILHHFSFNLNPDDMVHQFRITILKCKCISFKCIGMPHLESRHCLYDMCNFRSLALTTFEHINFYVKKKKVFFF